MNPCWDWQVWEAKHEYFQHATVVSERDSVNKKLQHEQNWVDSEFYNYHFAKLYKIYQ